MEVLRQSLITKEWHRREIPITAERLLAWTIDSNRRLIQDAFPELSKADREFILTGITSEEWDTHIRDDEEQQEGDTDAPAF